MARLRTQDPEEPEIAFELQIGEDHRQYTNTLFVIAQV